MAEKVTIIGRLHDEKSKLAAEVRDLRDKLAEANKVVARLEGKLAMEVGSKEWMQAQNTEMIQLLMTLGKKAAGL